MIFFFLRYKTRVTYSSFYASPLLLHIQSRKLVLNYHSSSLLKRKTCLWRRLSFVLIMGWHYGLTFELHPEFLLRGCIKYHRCTNGSYVSEWNPVAGFKTSLCTVKSLNRLHLRFTRAFKTHDLFQTNYLLVQKLRFLKRTFRSNINNVTIIWY